MLFVGQLGIAIMLPLMPLYALYLGATPLHLGLLTSAFTIANTATQLGTGLLVDRLGSRSFIRGGIATYAGANVLIATARSALELIAFRTVAGLGAGANQVAERLYVAQVADPRRLAFSQSVLSAAGSAGMVVGPAFGGLIAALSDLRVPFAVVGVTSSLAFLGSLRLPRPAVPRPTADELVPSAFDRSVITLTVASAFFFAGFGVFITTYAPFVTIHLGWSTVDVGLVWSVFGAGTIVLGPALGHLADRAGRRRVAATATIPVALFSVVAVVGLPQPVIYAMTFLTGGAVTAFSASWFAILATASAAARRGRTFAIVSALSNLGVVGGAALASLVWQSVGLGQALLTAAVVDLLAGLVLLVFLAERAAPLPAPALAD